MAYIVLIDKQRIAVASGMPIDIDTVVWGGVAELVDSRDALVADRCQELINCAQCSHAQYDAGYPDTRWDPGEPASYFCGLGEEMLEWQGEHGEQAAAICGHFIAKTVTACEVCGRDVPITVREYPQELGLYCCSPACRDRYVEGITAMEAWGDWEAI